MPGVLTWYVLNGVGNSVRWTVIAFSVFERLTVVSNTESLLCQCLSGTKRALLKVDIANAFNSCDRAAVPASEAQCNVPHADFGYATPSQLLQRCDGQHLLSSNGVRDPLSAILFCLYIREVLAEVSIQTKVEVAGFFDDVNVSGEPAEVMKAFDALKTLLPGVGLEFNTAKS
jgi:hypothetical protein